MAKSSKAKINANARYNQKNYENIGIWVRKGTRAVWRSYADCFGISLACFIQTAVNEYIQNHSPDPEKKIDDEN